MEPITRDEHVAFCKKRALEYVDRGDVEQAFSSIASDLDKHPETENHAGVEMGMMLMMIGDLRTPEQMRKFIEGFN